MYYMSLNEAIFFTYFCQMKDILASMADFGQFLELDQEFYIYKISCVHTTKFISAWLLSKIV